MSNISEIAKAQFKEKLGQGLKFVEVPEWPDENGDPTKIWYKAAVTFKQQDLVQKLIAENKQVEAIVQQFINRSLDVNGKPLFKQVEFKEIMRFFDPEVVSNIVIQMNEGAEDDDTVKKS